jgi:plastocyanin
MQEVHVKGKTRLVALGATAAIAVLGQTAAPAPVLGAGATVKATDNDSWSPKKKSVPAGTKVVWKNTSGDDHNLVAYKGAWSKSSSLPEGGKTSYKFAKKGKYKFRCTIHSEMEGTKCDGMCGTVVVG